MKLGKRVYWAIGLVAVLALAGAAVTFTARLTSASGSTPSADACEQAGQTTETPGTETADDQCGANDPADAKESENGSDAADANEAEDGNDAPNVNEPAGGDGDGEVNDDSASASEPASGDGDGEVNDDSGAQSGTLDDGKDLLPQAGITIDAAIAAAKTAGPGSIGEVDLEHSNGKLVFNVDVGDKDVKVDASNGAVLSADKND